MSAIYSFHDVWHTEDQVPFDAHQHIDNVFEAHGKYCAVELESLTHREDPRTRALAKEGKVMEMDRDDFAAIRIGGELVCMDCTEEGEVYRALADDIVTWENVEAEEKWLYCDRCKKLIRREDEEDELREEREEGNEEEKERS